MQFEIPEDSAGGGGGGGGSAGREAAPSKGAMPVCALFREPVDRMSRNFVCSTAMLAAQHGPSINFLAQVLCPWRVFEKYRARAAYRKNDAILTKIDTQLSFLKTHLHTKFQLSSFIRSPASADQSFSPPAPRHWAGRGTARVGHRLVGGGDACLPANLRTGKPIVMKLGV